MRIIHLIPTYNEAENVLRLIPQLQRLYRRLPRHKFITLFVDDKSPDGTASVIQAFHNQDQSFIVIPGPRKGLGAAMTFGYKYALKHLKPDVIISNEADFAYDHRKIPFMLQKITDGHDVIVASRHVSGGLTHGWTWSRHLNHWLANYFFATLIAGQPYVTDHNGAFRAVRVRGVLNKVKWTHFPKGFAFFNYLLFVLHRITPKFYEFPVTYRFRTRGESKISFNPKYLASYLRNVAEYINICLKIRPQKPGNKD